ncbi:hypothetical protein BSKO_04232 [Bryopsis sp. KO-2023]|nr:hypothetical protein BSKO_04232 [Bryopsis sp. KO-2023]
MRVAFVVGIVALWGATAVVAIPDKLSDESLDESAPAPATETDVEIAASPSDETVARALDDDVFVPSEAEAPAPEVVDLPPPLPSPSPPVASPSPTPVSLPSPTPSPPPPFSSPQIQIPEPPPETTPEEFPPEYGYNTQSEPATLDRSQFSGEGFDRQGEVDSTENVNSKIQDSNFRGNSARLVQNEIDGQGKKSSGTSASGVVAIILFAVVVAGVAGYGGLTYMRRRKSRGQNGWRPFDVEMTERMF